MLVGKQMQFFGARANLAKCLLYAINGGRDEITGKQVGPKKGAVEGDYLDFDDVLERFESMMDWIAGVYVNAMNIIHYMHDKYVRTTRDGSPRLCTRHHGWHGGYVGGRRQPFGDSPAKVQVVRDDTGSLITRRG
jgi:formate C-acetyltransferase